MNLAHQQTKLKGNLKPVTSCCILKNIVRKKGKNEKGKKVSILFQTNIPHTTVDHDLIFIKGLSLDLNKETREIILQFDTHLLKCHTQAVQLGHLDNCEMILKSL